jgi:hypothetical protein
VTPLVAVSHDYRLSAPNDQPPRLPRRAQCVRPGCPRTPQHGHHIVNRSITFGPKSWIEITLIQTGQIWLVYNIADVCAECHDSLESQVGGTNHRIRFLGASGWAWYRRWSGELDEGLTRILWHDSKTSSAWVLTGFLKGDRWVKSLK